MGNNGIKSSDVPSLYYSLFNNNYLPNSYKYLIRSKSVHFTLILIEALLNIFQELYIFVKGYNLEKDKQLYFYQFLIFIPEKIQNMPLIFKILIVLIYILGFDAIYYFLGKIECKKKKIHIVILYNIIELLYFRTSMLLFSNTSRRPSYTYFLILLLLLIPHSHTILLNSLFYNFLFFKYLIQY